MSRLTLDEHFRVVKTYFENSSLVCETHKSLRAFYGPHNQGDCQQHNEALSSARIPASAVRPPVALKGLSDVTTHQKGKWRQIFDPMYFLELFISILISIVLKKTPFIYRCNDFDFFVKSKL